MNRAAVMLWWARTRFRRFRTRAALLAYQERRAPHHLRRVLTQSPFNRARFEERRLSAWRGLTPIDKSAMMANFEHFNAAGITRQQALEVAMRAERTRDFQPTIGGFTVGLSSGTSGNLGVFLASPAERAQWAGAMLARALPSSLLSPRRDRVAFFLRANSNLYETLGSRRLRFEFFDLKQDPEGHLDRIGRLAPTLIVAPPSMLRLLADARDRGRLAISPERLISVAEVLEPMDEAVIRGTFGQPVHQIYQATEGFLGCTCAHGTLHLMEDLVVVDRERIPGATGAFHPIITDLWRSTQPMLRYRLDDVLIERTTPCPCGSPMRAIERIEGRADDTLHAWGPAGQRPVFPDFIRRAIPALSEGIADYAVTQTGRDRIELSLRLRPGVQELPLRARVEVAVQDIFVANGAGPLRFDWKTHTAPAPGSKLRRVRRQVTSGDEGVTGQAPAGHARGYDAGADHRGEPAE